MTVSVTALFVMKFSHRILKGNMNDGAIIVTLPTDEYQIHCEKIFTLLTEQIPQGRIDSITENNEDSVISYNFIELEQRDFLSLQNRLKEQTASIHTNLFYNRHGEI
jgi:hypothetical protein